jgi:seryl-tRNA synthetase
MLDIKRIIDNPEEVKAALLKRMDQEKIDLEGITELYTKQKEIQAQYEELRSKQNSYNDKMAETEKGSDEFITIVTELKDLATQVKQLEEESKSLSDQLSAKIEVLPNTPFDKVLAGEKENNKDIKVHGEIPTFDFPLKDHVELGESLGIFDFEKAAKISGSQFGMYIGDGALLEWALINLFIREHISDGYTMILPPHLLNEDTAYAAGQLPKFRDDVYWTQDGTCLLPTAETALAGYLKDEVVDESVLPLKLFSYTPCYRREAGGYRSSERGFMRVHQFNKVEMFQFTTEEQSDGALEELVAKAEKIVEKLGLHYKTVQLAAGDCSAAAAVTYDIEVYLPALDRYQEVSSCSNCTDYQTRRGNMKYKPVDGGKNRYLHSLNASGLATSRLIVAIMETYQNPDGSVTVPEVLRDFVGKDKIELAK